ncbi:MAG: ABC transporter permease, partial [Acidobacteria bacterium]|nr:ABC transporter permease [Acidobacteriota bacterium]
MITNYLTATMRRLLKNKVFSLINILGLTIGMTAFIFIFQYIKYEESYDRFRAHSDNLYRLFTKTYESGQMTWEGLWCSIALAPAMKEDIPEVLDYARLLPLGLNVITYKDTKIIEPMYYAADASFLTMFSIPMLRGNAETALKEPDGVVISKSAAKKYFGNEDPMGKVLAISNNYGKFLYTVTGIFADVPPNSHIKFDILVSILNNLHGHPWNDTNYLVYLLLKPGADPKTVEAKLPAFLDKYLGDVFKKNNRRDIITLQAVKDIHLSAGILDEFFQYVKKGNAETIGYLRIISFLVLLIAWINYINLSIAYSMVRGREIGIRKVVGATRSQIMLQSVMETIAITILGFLAAIGIIFLFLPLFPRVTGIPVLKEMWLDPLSWLMVFFIFISGAILSALFPAQFLASLKPNMLLKGNFVNSKTGVVLRKGFTIFQFTASIALIACTLTIYMQNRFIDSFDGGYVKEDILMANQPTLYLQHPETINSFKTEISQYTEFGDITAACFVPGMGNPATVSVRRMSDTNTKLSTLNFVDYNFLNFFQIKLVTGRNFLEDYSTDENAIIINEAAVKFLNFENPEKAINQTIIDSRVILPPVSSGSICSCSKSVSGMQPTLPWGFSLQLCIVAQEKTAHAIIVNGNFRFYERLVRAVDPSGIIR